MTDLPRWQTTGYYRSLPRWKQCVLENADLFVLRYFPHRIDGLEDFHYDLINTALNEVRGLTLYPAGHGKTTLVSTIIPIIRICRDPDWREAIIAKNDAEAESIMGVIQSELVDNTQLVKDFGAFKPDDPLKPWALGRIQVAKRTRRAKEATIAVFGAGAKTVLGYRTDHTTCDDVVTGENSATATQREKTRNWFDLCVETGPEHEDSGLTVVGTRFDPHDLYGDLIEMIDPETGEQIWHVDEVDAIVDEDRKITRWPSRWTWARLMQQKAKAGTLNFNKRYRNKAVDSSRMVVKEAYVRGGWDKGVQYPGCLDRDHRIGPVDQGWRIVAGFDPAGGKSRHAKFCAHAVLAEGSCRDHERCFWVLDLDRGQWTLPQQVDLLIRKHEEYDVQVTVIETNAFQIGLQEAVMQKQNEQGLVHTMEPHYTGARNKVDPETGVQGMAPWFEQGKFHIPWGDPRSQRVMAQLVDELVTFPDARTSDTVMAVWFAWRKLEQSAPKFQSFNRLDRQTSRRPWITPSRRGFVRNPAYPPREREAV